MQAHRPTRSLLFQCPLCKELVHLQRFAAEDGELAFECSSCHEVALYTTTLCAQDLLGYAERGVSSKQETPSEEKTEEGFVSSKNAVLSNSSSSLESLSQVFAKHEEPTPRTSKTADPELDEPDIRSFCPKCWERRLVGNASCHKCGLLFANIGVTFDPRLDAAPTGTSGKEARKIWSEALANWDDQSIHERFLRYCQGNSLLEFAAQNYRKERARRGPDEFIDTQLERLLEMAQQQFFQAQKAEEEPSNSVVRIVVLLLMLLGGGTLLVMLLRFWQSGSGAIAP